MSLAPTYPVARPFPTWPVERPQSVAVPTLARDFDGTDDQLITGVGGLGITTTGPVTMMALALIRGAATGTVFGTMNVALTGTSYALERAATGTKVRAVVSGVAQDAPTLTFTQADGWVIVGWTKAGGTATPRFHIYKDGAWSHEDAGGTLGNMTSVGEMRFGQRSDTNRFNGTLAVCAVWNVALNDAQVETLENNWRSQDWWDVSAPVGLWELNQGDAATDVLDQSGGGANETSLTGTAAVSAGPPGWVYGVTTGTLGATSRTNSAEYAGGLGAEPRTSTYGDTTRGAAPRTAAYPP